MKKKWIVFCFVLVLLPVLLGSCFTVGIEKPSYSVLFKEGSLEVRRYEPMLVAETVVDSDFDESGNIAFRRLFKYISGDNQKKQEIAMTAPVNQQTESEKISMTAPVNMEKTRDKYAVNFVMPKKYTMETIPQPLDPDVIIKEIAPRKIAAIRYSGTWSRERFESHKQKLEDFIEDRKLTPTGEPIFARYDPPFQLWFLRRNEVMIPVE